MKSGGNNCNDLPVNLLSRIITCPNLRNESAVTIRSSCFSTVTDVLSQWLSFFYLLFYIFLNRMYTVAVC